LIGQKFEWRVAQEGDTLLSFKRKGKEFKIKNDIILSFKEKKDIYIKRDF
jgi:hypothetical protein